MSNTRCYSELIEIDDFLGRYRYLKLEGNIGIETFGFDRYLNQALYRDQKWKDIREQVIIRDNGCDLGIPDRFVDKIIVHHMNPITPKQIMDRDPIIFDTEFLICTSLGTHNAIHYSDESKLCIGPTIRTPNDTCPWKR